MAKTLVVTEKPSVAQSLAAVLGANKRGDGYLEGGDWLISWCFGHLVELAPAEAYGEQYRRWSYDTLPILPDVWKYRASEGKKKQLDILRSLMNRADVDSIVNACDSGREGELIFRLVYEQCKCGKPTQRLWISSLEDATVRDGFAKLRPGADYDNLYRAALCRSKADFLVGINTTRLFSCLYGTTLNVGRVQSPTLALIVSREEAVRSFVSEPFYTPEIDCGQFTASSEKHRNFDAADAIRAAADGQEAVVLSVEKQTKTIAPPRLYDLTSLQREANRLFSFTAQQTLDYAQSLYETYKFITYPRTDSRYLTPDMEEGVTDLVRASAAILPFPVAGELDINTAAVINAAGVTDHHAIIPTPSAAGADLSSLPSGERDILSMIAVRLLCAVGDKHSYEAVTAVLECGGHQFTAKGKTVLLAGWKAIDEAFRSTLINKPDDDAGEDGGRLTDDTALPELSKGRTFESVTATVREGKTSPPKRYTEDTLLSAMETAGAGDFPDDAECKGLGTPATRAAIIEKLIKFGFVERQKKSLVPSNKGISLIAVLPEDIKSPLLTAEWEQKLKLVERGEFTDAGFMDEIASLTRELVTTHRVPALEYAALFREVAHHTSEKRGDSIGVCHRCASPVTESAKGFFCSSRTCKFAMWKDNRFFGAKGKKLTKTTATALLSEGRVFFSDLRSEKTGKTYAAAVLLEDDGAKTNYKLDFEKGRDKI